MYHLNKLGDKEKERSCTSIGAKELPTDTNGTAVERGDALVTERASNFISAAFASNTTATTGDVGVRCVQ